MHAICTKAVKITLKLFCLFVLFFFFLNFGAQRNLRSLTKQRAGRAVCPQQASVVTGSGSVVGLRDPAQNSSSGPFCRVN